MRNEQVMMGLFKTIVQNDERIRLSVLEGSRTNSHIPKDNFQDYDISFFVTDMNSYKEDDKWLDTFGEVIFMQKPEDMELFPGELGNWFSYLMYFSDGLKIDLTLIPLHEVELYFKESDGLVEILIDKDGRVKEDIVASDEKYWIKRPSEREFDDSCNEFWFVAGYVAKGLYRGEILFALDHMNQILRPELLRMMGWKIGLKDGFDFSLGKNYKFIDQYLSKEEFDMLLKTYSMEDHEKAWNSFWLCCELFRKYSKNVASSLKYNYPNYDEVMTDFIHNVYGKMRVTGEN